MDPGTTPPPPPPFPCPGPDRPGPGTACEYDAYDERGASTPCLRPVRYDVRPRHGRRRGRWACAEPAHLTWAVTTALADAALVAYRVPAVTVEDLDPDG